MSRARKWIVTGGAGFIGANVIRALGERGIAAVAIDNLSRPSAPLNLEWLTEAGLLPTFVHADVRDADAVDTALADHADAEAVLHLAGQVAVTSSILDPRDDFESNAIGTFNLLEAVRSRIPEAAVLYASTNKVYGSLQAHRLDERETRYVDLDFPKGIPSDYALDPHSPYGCSKAAGELYVRDYARVYGLRAVSFRQSCIYGPRQFGVEDQGWVAWLAIAAALDAPITIYGTGKQVRDLLHVDDLVGLYLRAVEIADRVTGRAYNVGGGAANTLSLLELVARLEERLGHQLALRFEDFRPADQRVFVCDLAAAEADFDWRPEIGLANGLERLLDWIERHADQAARLLAAA